MKLTTTLLTLLAPSLALADLSSIVEADTQATELGTGLKFTEGPVWIPAQNKLVFSDIPASVQMQWTGEDGVTKFQDVEATNGNLLDLDGNLISCQHQGRNVVQWNADGSAKVLADKFDGNKFNSPNDLAIHSDGSLWFTDPSYGLKGRPREVDGKNVYRLAPDGAVTMVYDGFDMPNGIAFSPDEKRVYIACSGSIGKVRAFDINTDHTLSDMVFELDVRCDGMTIDTKGNIYTTARGGIHVFDKTGAKLGVIPTPQHPANVCFGGKRYDTLFVTARTGLYSIKTKATGAKPKAAKW